MHFYGGDGGVAIRAFSATNVEKVRNVAVVALKSVVRYSKTFAFAPHEAKAVMLITRQVC